MSEISPVGPGTAGIPSLPPPLTGLAATATHRVSLNGVSHSNGVDSSAAAAPGAGSRQPDVVELSDRAVLLGLQSAADIRQERVAAARQMIERGEYPSEQQLEIAIERMVAKLRD